MSIDRNPKPAWLIAGALATAVALVAGLAALWLWFADPDEAVETRSQTYTQAVDRIELNLAAGHITVVAGQSGQVAVERRLQWKRSKPTTSEEWSGDALRITATCPGDGEDCAVDYTVRVPAGVAVSAQTGAGDMSVRDLTGQVRLDSGSGHVTVDNTTGDLSVVTAAGDITGSGLRSASTSVETEAGHVTLRFAAAPTTVRSISAAGDVAISVPQGTEGYLVRAETKAGDREVRVREDSSSTHTISASTESGHVTVGYA